jgi:2,4-dienoyl-CoA reductase-like NADH-dependent reductase (Old Yellow Enzyme family)/thioredoxin reductase
LTSQPTYPRLFSPFSLDALSLPNRVIMAPMSTSLGGLDGEVTPENIAFYKERAEGGFGLIIVEFTCVDRSTGRTEERQLALDDERYLDGHKRLVDAVKAAGAKVFVQLQHGGRFAPAKYQADGISRGPSAVYSRKDPSKQIVKPFSSDEVGALAEAFGQTAALAQRAGYDGVEVHGAHGYLVSQFLSPFSNQRDDAWGGDAERRLAFPLAVIRAVKDATGSLPLSFRVSADEFIPGGLTLDDMEVIAPRLVEAGTDILHVSTGRGPEAFDKVMEPTSAPEGWRLPYARRLREVTGAPVIGVGQIRWPETAEAAIVDGDADLIALGRPSLADPAWPRKAAAGQRSSIRPCTSCNWCISGATPAVTCAENPRAGHEAEPEVPADLGTGRRAVVVGGGPAGQSAALFLKGAGFETRLLEADSSLAGGGLVASATPPGKDKLFWFRDYLAEQVAQNGISVSLGQRATANDVAELHPDIVFIATGTQSRPLSIDGAEHAFDAYDVLMQHVDPKLSPGDTVLVYGGGETGCETAEYCAELGAKVVLVTRSSLDKLARSAEMVYRIGLLARLRTSSNITIEAECRLIEIGKDTAIIQSADGSKRTIEARHVLLAQGRDPSNQLADALCARNIECHVVGDSVRPGRIGDAVHSAYEAVAALSRKG